jgi:hypothetical protein
MATKSQRKIAGGKLHHRKPLRAAAGEALALADKALARYGEPNLSLDELRDELEKQIPGISLSELITREREAQC